MGLKSIHLALSLFFIIMCTNSIFSSELKSGVFQFGNGKKGYVFLPENYQPGKNAHFILFMHGRGGDAGTSGNVGDTPFEQFRKLCSEKNYIIAVPSMFSNWFNDQAEKDVEEMLQHLQNLLKIDLGRFYLAGCSMGGMGALAYAGRHSERIIAICDFFGPTDIKVLSESKYKENMKIAYGGYYDERQAFYKSRNPMTYASVLKEIPLLVIHGEKDSAVPPEQSKSLVDEIVRLGGRQARLIMVPKIGHSNEIVRGLEEEILTFFEQHQK